MGIQHMKHIQTSCSDLSPIPKILICICKYHNVYKKCINVMKYFCSQALYMNDVSSALSSIWTSGVMGIICQGLVRQKGHGGASIHNVNSTQG